MELACTTLLAFALVPLVPHVQYSRPRFWWVAAVVFLVLGALFRRWRLRWPVVLAALPWVVLAGAWAEFIALDLARTRFVVVLALPVMFGGIFFVVSVLAAPGGCERTHLRRLTAGVLVGMTWVYALMVLRADNGCTGVSDSYEGAMLTTCVVVFSCGPGLLMALLRTDGAVS